MKTGAAVLARPPWISLPKVSACGAMPTCVLVQEEQAFAIPVSNQFQLREPAKYLQPLMQLRCVAKELITERNTKFKL